MIMGENRIEMVLAYYTVPSQNGVSLDDDQLCMPLLLA
jgi:hypothetical protein